MGCKGSKAQAPSKISKEESKAETATEAETTAPERDADTVSPTDAVDADRSVKMRA